jgi:hypothetical protein
MTPWLPERLWQDEFCNGHSGMVVARRPPKKIALIITSSGSSLSGSSRMAKKIPSRRIARDFHVTERIGKAALESGRYTPELW